MLIAEGRDSGHAKAIREIDRRLESRRSWWKYVLCAIFGHRWDLWGNDSVSNTYLCKRCYSWRLGE